MSARTSGTVCETMRTRFRLGPERTSAMLWINSTVIEAQLHLPPFIANHTRTPVSELALVFPALAVVYPN
jgi:hypothetical protein